MAKSNDTLSKTFTVVIALCLVCSIIVSGAAVGLKSKQEAEAALAKQTNILSTAGVSTEGQSINDVFASRVKIATYNQETGEVVAFDSLTAMDTHLDDVAILEQSEAASAAGVRDLRNEIPVFAVMSEQGDVQTYVMDIRGAGLWGTMYAFLAVEPDGQTIRDILFYKHQETPGLGGEIQNPRWTANFEGLTAVTDSGDVAVTVGKGAGAQPNGVDALSGATITSNGVNSTLNFWLSENGYGPLLAKLREEGAIL
ncbi:MULTISPECIES: Na(+)-translocating NADH-quinone reductase subunit C [Gammaproteobacteria]|uniref:Na(+)-translocating NADH-quinone reductase subunit C n=1 Tax=Gammaproteobacteria TaxID=1236 RepID=UPI000DCF904E|nr:MULTISPECIES: Na(+)-translocating NADH-quinone reductase subunit C [Gammaproteobacteria]RTE86037.1 Na(+)-translocating NADH-quinone reductase subunit C [Aliidiomarina sp. B3213]TCZ91391.1 Na(+)-translocating NADH-quinone reductase subunit C [Lysobacter sp. N42]